MSGKGIINRFLVSISFFPFGSILPVGGRHRCLETCDSVTREGQGKVPEHCLPTLCRHGASGPLGFAEGCLGLTPLVLAP